MNAVEEGLSNGDFEVLNALSDGVYVTDRDRRILFWNSAAKRLTGWDASQIVGTCCFDDILAHVDIDGHKLCGDDFCPLHRAIMQNQASRIPEIVFAKCADGSRVAVEVTVAPLRNRTGHVIGGIESFRDLGSLLTDLQRARIIQDSSMTFDTPANNNIDFAVRSIPNEYVSGDFFRMEHLGKGIYAFMVGDVMGHGVSAALHTMQISSLWLEERSCIQRPAFFMSRLNHALSQLTRDEDFFASAVIGLFDTHTRRLTYANAGHPHPLLQHDGHTRPLNVTRPALGLIPDTTYIAITVELEAGDRLLFYTDGCIEINGPDGAERGTTGLCDLLDTLELQPASRLVDSLTDILLRDSGLQRFPDDVTLLALNVNS